MKISRRPQHTRMRFFLSTIAAQTHFVTCVLAAVSLFFLVPLASVHGTAHVASAVIFAGTAVNVFGVSAFYHFVSDGYQASPKLISLLEKLDHWAIYLFIAGTYTPVLLNLVSPPWQLVLMIGIWTCAVIGILYTKFRDSLPKWAQSRAVYTGVFLFMGWILLVRIGEVWANLSSSGAWYLFGGAASYSVGAVVYVKEWPKLFPGFFGFHELWHIFVTVGFICHFLLIWNFYSPF